MRTKLKNYITGGTVEKTFRAGEKVQQANLNRTTKQYTYMDGDQVRKRGRWPVAFTVFEEAEACRETDQELIFDFLRSTSLWT